jgi:hypothetical protein
MLSAGLCGLLPPLRQLRCCLLRTCALEALPRHLPRCSG